jgi:hypothetical protein
LLSYKDDEDLNEELKAKERWNDPAEMFLTKVVSVFAKFILRCVSVYG